MTVKKLQKKAKLRNAEYFGLQEVLDRLYAQSAENKRYTVLMELVAADENILLAYRNISKNKGSKTAGTDGKTVRYLSKFTNTALIHYIKKAVGAVPAPAGAPGGNPQRRHRENSPSGNPYDCRQADPAMLPANSGADMRSEIP